MTAHDRRGMTSAQRAGELAEEMRARGFTVTGVKVTGRAVEVLTNDGVKTEGDEMPIQAVNPADWIDP